MLKGGGLAGGDERTGGGRGRGSTFQPVPQSSANSDHIKYAPTMLLLVLHLFYRIRGSFLPKFIEIELSARAGELKMCMQ